MYSYDDVMVCQMGQTVKYTLRQMVCLQICQVFTMMRWKEHSSIVAHFSFILAEELSWLSHLIGHSAAVLSKC